MSVFVKNQRNQSLMPTTPRKARILLKEGKAKVVCRIPFTIKLLTQTGESKQNLTLGIDTGSKTIGSAVVRDNGKVVYTSEVVIRNDISDILKERLVFRRDRRNRNTRYRKCRILNRRNSTKKGRLTPTIKSKIDSHLKEIDFVNSILPITKTILETATFDTVALANPGVKLTKDSYQKGINYGFANTKSYVLSRDGYSCRNCKTKKSGTRFEVHHIVKRSDNGSDHESNLITLCKKCHYEVHNENLVLKTKGKFKSQLKHATHMSSIRKRLLKILNVSVKETFGYITKENRQNLGLDKSHYIDAVVIASEGRKTDLSENRVLFKRCVAKGSYRLTRGIGNKRKNRPTGKICGYRLYDKVEYLGEEYFVKMRMSSGYASLCKIDNILIKMKPMAKFCKMKRISARKSWLISY